MTLRKIQACSRGLSEKCLHDRTTRPEQSRWRQKDLRQSTYTARPHHQPLFFGEKYPLTRKNGFPILRTVKSKFLSILRIKPECEICDKIQGIHNQVWACRQCNSSKGTKGLYEFYKAKYPNEKKFYDLIPPLLEKKYLKTIYNCHKCVGTLNKGDIDGDGEISVMDIDFILH